MVELTRSQRDVEDDMGSAEDPEKGEGAGGGNRNPVRRMSTRLGGVKTMGTTVASNEELSNLVDILESIDSDDETDDGKLGSRSWSGEDERVDYDEFSPVNRKASGFRPPPMINTAFSSGGGTSGEMSTPPKNKLMPKPSSGARTRRSSSISPKQAIKGAFKRGSTMGTALKKRIARR